MCGHRAFCTVQLLHPPSPQPPLHSDEHPHSSPTPQEEEVRPDGRGLDGFRRCTVAMGEIGTADGSAIVRLGETAVIAGIKAEIANPPIDSPDTGWLVPNVTLPRM